MGTGEPGPITPLMHHMHADGTTDLLLPEGSVLLDRLRDSPDDELPVMLEVTGHAPVPLAEPVRELLWVVGRLRRPKPGTARRIALQLAELRPHPALLDLGHGAVLLRVSPGPIVYSDAEGSAPIDAGELAAATPDPFCLLEQRWLAHLDDAHPGVFTALVRHLPSSVRLTDGARLRPLGVDRFGMRVRVQTPTGDHDVRLAWSSEARTVDELRVRFGELTGCPHRDAE